MNNDTVIRTPRPFSIMLVQYIAGGSLLLALIVLCGTFIAASRRKTPFSASEITFCSLFVCVGILCAYLLYSRAQRRVPYVHIDRSSRYMHVTVRDNVKHKYEIVEIKSVISINNLSNRQYTLFIEKDDSNRIEIFCEDTPYGGEHWMAFAAKLAAELGVELVQETWAEDYHGKAQLLSPEKHSIMKKKGVQALLVPFCISLCCAILFMFSRSLSNFFVFGTLSVITNMSLTFWFYFKNRDIARSSDSLTVDVTSIVTTIIPYSFYYLQSVAVLMGLRWIWTLSS